MERHGLNLSDLRQGPTAGYCKQSIKHVSINFCGAAQVLNAPCS